MEPIGCIEDFFGRSEMFMNCEANHCIKCNVKSCRNHCENEDYCSLNCITVGTHETHPSQNACTDCQSFFAK